MISLYKQIDTGTINAEDWQKGDRLKSVALLIAYLDEANFYIMEDSGAWEEDARLNTSSVALVTSGLERLSNLLSKKDSVFVSDLLREAKANELDATFSTTRLTTHIISDKRINVKNTLSVIDLGGESPGYLEKDKHYREADAALLNVIYPANLSKINTRRKEQVLK